MIDHNQVLEAIRVVQDPNTGHDVVQARRISELRINGNNIYFTLDATEYDSKVKGDIYFALESAIVEHIPGAVVHIHMKSTAPHLRNDEDRYPHIKNIIAVASGKGGVGKSTISANLAIALAQQGASVGLIDADLYGPSIPTLLGLKGQRPKVKELYGKHKILPLSAYGVHVISIGFIVEPEQAVILRGPRLSGVIKQFINDCIWPDLDYLVIDLPPGTGDIQLTLVQTVPVTGAIIVTTPQELSVIDAVKAMNMFRIQNINVPILGVIENMSWFTPEELPDNKYYLFGKGGGTKLAEQGETVLLGQVPLVESIRESSDEGKPVVTGEEHSMYPIFHEIARKTAEQLNLRNKTMDPTKRVEIKTS